MKQPKNSPPPELIAAADEAENEVEMDLAEKLGPVMDGMRPSERRAVEAAALALASKVVGEAIARKQAMQAFAVALTAMNAYRESTGGTPIDPESASPMMLVSMMEELLRDEDFMEFIAGEVDVEPEGADDEMPEGDENEGEEETPTSLTPRDRRSTLMGAI